MNIQQFEYVLAVSELKSFGQAADKCCITQSTLSTMVGRFEQEIDIQLFDRKTKPITVTKEGEQVIEQLKRVIKEIKGLKDLVGELKDEMSGTIRIGVIPTIAPYLLPLFLNEFLQQFPQVHFDISEITTEKIIQRLESRDLDIGIASLPLERPQLIELPLYREPFLFFDATKTDWNPPFRRTNIDLGRLWLLEEGHCMLNQVERICNLKANAPQASNNLAYRSGSVDSLIRFVNKHDGNTLLPLLSTLDFTEEERSHLTSFFSPEPVRSVGLITHQHFVKQRMLTSLKRSILTKVAPLLRENEAGFEVVSPV